MTTRSRSMSAGRDSPAACAGTSEPSGFVRRQLPQRVHPRSRPPLALPVAVPTGQATAPGVPSVIRRSRAAALDSSLRCAISASRLDRSACAFAASARASSRSLETAVARASAFTRAARSAMIIAWAAARSEGRATGFNRIERVNHIRQLFQTQNPHPTLVGRQLLGDGANRFDRRDLICAVEIVTAPSATDGHRNLPRSAVCISTENADSSSPSLQFVRVTHPFHPSFGDGSPVSANDITGMANASCRRMTALRYGRFLRNGRSCRPGSRVVSRWTGTLRAVDLMELAGLVKRLSDK